MSTAPRYILALLPLQHHYARQIATGLRRYERDRAAWRVRIDECEPSTLKKIMNSDVGPHIGGLIAFAIGEPLRKAIHETGLPVVNVSGRSKPDGIPTVVSDNQRIGELAAEHLLDRKFERFAYVAKPGLHFSNERQLGFTRNLNAAGMDYRIFEDGQTDTFLDWVTSNDKPVGLFTCFDAIARAIVDASHDRDINVPEKLAVIGADDNEFNCQQGRILISSVPTEGRRVGFFAAALLDRLMQGENPPDSPMFIAPVTVVARESTEVVAATDPIVAEALRYIHLHACDPINVAELSDHTGIARRTLEKHFRAALDRTPHEEIRRVQFDRAFQLLADTDMKIAEVARRAGFTRSNYFMTEFKRQTGQTPSEYRNQIRQGHLEN